MHAVTARGRSVTLPDTSGSQCQDDDDAHVAGLSRRRAINRASDSSFLMMSSHEDKAKINIVPKAGQRKVIAKRRRASSSSMNAMFV